MSDAELERWRVSLARAAVHAPVSPDDLRRLIRQMGEDFKNNAPLTASEAATTILDALRAGAWRILVGKDAEALDAYVRRDPDTAYDHSKMS